MRFFLKFFFLLTRIMSLRFSLSKQNVFVDKYTYFVQFAENVIITHIVLLGRWECVLRCVPLSVQISGSILQYMHV